MSNTNKGLDALLATLHEETAKELLNRVKSGEATAADLSAAIKFLKDNNIELVPSENNTLGDLASQVPFKSSDEEYLN